MTREDRIPSHLRLVPAQGADPRFPVLPGLTLTRVCGRGAETVVFAARRDLDGWECAVKVYAGAPAPQPGGRGLGRLRGLTGGESDRRQPGRDEVAEREVARLWREAAVGGSLRLPHLVRIHDVLTTADGRPALILDLVDGGSVRAVLAQRRLCSPGEVVTILVPLLRTLAELHARGIVHGDVSAGNVLLDRDGRPFLSDLGDARVVGEQRPEVRGTPGYIAPELAGGAQAGAASDVYAAGALAWLLLTGRPASYGIVRDPLERAAPGVPPALAAVIEQMLRGDPDRRPDAAAAAEVVAASARAQSLERATGPERPDHLTQRIRVGTGGESAGGAGSGVGPGAVSGVGPGAVSGVGSGAGSGVGGAGRVASLSGRQLLRGVAPGAGTGPGRPAAPERSGNRAQRVLRHPVARVVLVLVVLSGLVDAVGGWSAVSGWAAGLRSGVGVSFGASGVEADPSAAPSSLGPASAAVETEVRRLADLRAAAYREADPSSLQRVYAPGSAALASETERVQRLRDVGARYEGLTYTVRVLASTAAADTATADTAMADTAVATMATSGYVVRYADGRRVARPASAAVPVRLQLVRAEGGWLLVSVETSS